VSERFGHGDMVEFVYTEVMLKMYVPLNATIEEHFYFQPIVIMFE